jgi:hypothetical protein
MTTGEIVPQLTVVTADGSATVERLVPVDSETDLDKIFPVIVVENPRQGKRFYAQIKKAIYVERDAPTFRWQPMQQIQK